MKITSPDLQGPFSQESDGQISASSNQKKFMDGVT
jgi:hypothetical protein